MTDRESIVAFIKQKIEAADTVSIVACQNLLAEIERCADLKPAKPKATIADLLALHDLDLGALAHKVGVTGEGFTTAHSESLCGGFIAESRMDAVTWNEMCNMAGDWGAVARQLAAIGAKVRTAMSAPTIKVIKARADRA